MIEFLLNWIDLLWLPAIFFAMNKELRWKGIVFVLMCILTLRLQLDFFHTSGGERGFMPFLDSKVIYRGYVTYGLFILGFLGLMHFSKERNTHVYIVAGISVYTIALCLSSLVMIL